MDPVAFHARVLAHAGADRRLPRPADVPTVEIFPYETAGLVPIPIDPLELPEPARHGEDARDCRCTEGLPAHALWAGERWYLTPLSDSGIPGVMLHCRAHLDLHELDDQLAAELGLLTVRIARALESVPGIGRVHVNRWGDGSAHFHQWFFARPAGFLQARGSSLADWTEILPPVTAEDSREVWAAAVAAAQETAQEAAQETAQETAR